MGFTITAGELKRFLEANGFYVVSQNGSHLKMTNGARITVVPMHTGDMKQKTARGILAQAGFTVNDVMNWR
jgi:predicted RNA binding protein YcfA (HicA-like mRNA interferase family)